jgi:ATP-binding cassette subfamily B protein
MFVLMAVIAWLTLSFSRGGLEVGILVTFTLAAFRAIKGNSQLSNAVASASESALAILPLLDFLDVGPTISDKGGLTPEHLEGHIELENVSFTYPHNSEPVINNLSLSIPPGQTVAIVGRNGTGKSTLIKLIARLYDVDEGEIRIDGINIKDLSLRWLHAHLAMVFQKTSNFEGTVHDNIAFGDWLRLKDDPDEVQRIADQIGMLDFVKKLPQGFDTHLGRLFGEMTLSVGEWQLMEIARALARRDSVLILDEPTSMLDVDAEHSLFEAIRVLADKKTVILISHRLSTVKKADRIIMLEAGVVVEDGSHEQLIARGGFYANMVESQTGEVILK